jgi:hypothetical protein
MSLKIIAGAPLVESSVDESDSAFIEAVHAMLLTFYRDRPEWLHLSAGARFRLGAAMFREVVCAAGSVYAQLIHLATSRTGLPRAVVYRVESSRGHRVYEIRERVERETGADELHAA